MTRPLLIAPQKLEVILGVLAPRLGLAVPPRRRRGQRERPPRKPYEVTPDGIAIIPIEGTLVHKTYGLDALSGLRSYVDIQEEIEDAATDPAIRGHPARHRFAGRRGGGRLRSGRYDLRRARGKARLCRRQQRCLQRRVPARLRRRAALRRPHLRARQHRGDRQRIWTSARSDEKLGYKYTIIHAGARKADFNPHAPLSEEARAVIEAEVERTYGMLVAAVARNRGLAEAAVRDTEAGLYFGSDAVNTRLADRMGTRQDALADLRAAIESRFSTRAALSAPIQPKGETTMNQETAVRQSRSHPPWIWKPSGPRRAGRATPRRARSWSCAVWPGCRTKRRRAARARCYARRGPPAADAKRAQQDAAEIRSHVMPGTGTQAKADLADNPVVQAVERLTGTAKGGN